MGQYILVEKDSKVMQKFWKWLIISVLITILITCFLSSYAFSALISNFNGNCVTGAELAFKRLNQGSEEQQNFYNKKADELNAEFKSFYLSKDLRDIDDTSAVPKTQIYQFLTNGPNIFQTTTEKTSIPYSVSTIPANDSDFFHQINEVATKWGDNETCLMYYYFPVIEITVAVVWVLLIIISRRQGERQNFMVIHKAWRLVVPAVVCFGILAICCCVYAGYLNSALNHFCDEFQQKFTNHEISCQVHILRYSINEDTLFTSATNFYMAKSVAYIRIFLWLLAGFIMLMRCVLGADFEMQEVEYCTQQSGMAFDPEIDDPNRVKFIDDGIRRYSKERVYRPTTTELQPLE